MPQQLSYVYINIGPYTVLRGTKQRAQTGKIYSRRRQYAARGSVCSSTRANELDNETRLPAYDRQRANIIRAGRRGIHECSERKIKFEAKGLATAVFK